jgi:YD repeat-containing protein
VAFPRGSTTTSATFGRLLSVTYAFGTAEAALFQYQYDAAGNITALIDDLGRKTAYDYDRLDRLTKLRQPDRLTGQPASSGVNLSTNAPITRFAYDRVGNLITVVVSY